MPRFLPTDVTAGPPPEVLLEIDIAWERSREMFSSEIQLRFEVDKARAKVWDELRLADCSVDGDGTASEARAIACGDVARERALAPA